MSSLDLKEDMVENHFDKNGDTGSSVDSITNIKMRKKQTKVNEENNQKTWNTQACPDRKKISSCIENLVFLLMNGLKATEITKYDKSMKGLYLLLQHTIACGNI